MRRKTKKILAAACGVCAAACLAVFGVRLGTPAQNALAEKAESVSLEQELETQYVAGEIFEAPAATLTYGGNQYVADSDVTVYCPDGSVLSGSRFTLDKTGNYTLVYETTVSGTRVTAEKTFAVVAPAYVLPNSCSYTYEETVKTQSPTQFAGGGLNVELAMGAEFVYNRAIDLSGASLSTPVVTFAPYQYSNYMLDAAGRPVAQANEIYVRLTDAYDPNNYIELYLLNRSKDLTTHESGKRSYPYLSVGASGQEKLALDTTSRYAPEFNNGKIVNVDGSEYCAVYENFGVNHGLMPYGQALNPDGVTGNDGQGGYFSLYYDDATKRIYVTAPTRNGGAPAVMKQIFLNDLDSTGIYPTNPFKGFTTGEVYLSVRADDYLTDKMQFELLEVYGERGTDFASSTVQDTRAPLLTFDRVDETQSFLVQKNAAVSLPTATALDLHLAGDVEKRVYYAYQTEKQLLVNSDGGVFTPTKTGAYTAEYIATDTYGNKTVKTLLFSCVEEEVVTFSVEQLKSGFEAGAAVSLPLHTVSSLNGGAFVDVYATFGEEKIEIDETNPTFFAQYVGEYTLTYVYGDALETKTYSYRATSVASDNIVFGDFMLPKYFIKDAYYTLDTVYAYTYRTAEPVAVKAKAFVKEDDAASFTEIGYESYLVSASKTVQFKYVCEGVETLSEAVPVVDVGFGSSLAMENYFVGDVTKNAQKKYVEIVANGLSGDTTVQFVNPVAFSNFRFEFSIPEEAAAFDGVEIKLTDYYDESVFVALGYYKNGVNAQFRCGTFSADITQPFVGTEFSLWYNEAVKKMTDGFGATYGLENIFSSDRVFLEFTLKNASGANGIRVLKICNQTIGNNARDRYPAAFSFENLFGGLNEIDTTVTVFAGEATDVLTPFYAENLRVSVEDPLGNYVTATDGTLLENASAIKPYDFVTKEYGMYIVSYSYLDQKGNEVTGMYYVQVADMVSPTVTLENGYNEKVRVLVKAGEEVKIAGYTVSDNVTAVSELKTVVYVMQANGELIEVKDGKFTAKNKGDYVVYYYCYDTDENYTIVKYYVRAE